MIANGRLVSRDGARRAGHHPLARRRADGALPRVLRGREFQTSRRARYRRPALVRRGLQQLPSGQRAGLMRLMEAAPRSPPGSSEQLGRYPFSTTGGVVTGLPVGFALENQTRPTYPASRPAPSRWSCTSWRTSGSATRCRSQRWSDIWLNEGSRPSWRCATPRRTAASAGAAWLRDAYTSHRADRARSGSSAIGDPGRAAHLRRRGLRPRRDDPAGAAQPCRRGRLLGDPAHLGAEPAPRQRFGRAVPGAAPSRQRRGPRRRSSPPGSTAPADRPTPRPTGSARAAGSAAQPDRQAGHAALELLELGDVDGDHAQPARLEQLLGCAARWRT